MELGLGRREDQPGAAAGNQAREDKSGSRALAMRSGKFGVVVGWNPLGFVTRRM